MTQQEWTRMEEAEETVRNLEYVKCPSCDGEPASPSRLHYISRCGTCDGWGQVINTPNLAERVKMGMRAMTMDAVLDVTPPSRPAPPPRRRARRL